MSPVLLGGLLVVAGLLLVFWDRRASRRRRAFAHWLDVEGRVTASRVVSAGEAEAPSGASEPLWTAEVAYGYAVEGTAYAGTQRRFAGLAAGSFAAAERVAAAFPVGAPVEVAVDPDAPARSVLPYDPPNRGLVGLGLVAGMLGLLLLMAG